MHLKYKRKLNYVNFQSHKKGDDQWIYYLSDKTAVIISRGESC